MEIMPRLLRKDAAAGHPDAGAILVRFRNHRDGDGGRAPGRDGLGWLREGAL